MASQALVERGESVALQVFGEDYAAIKQGIAPDLTDVELDYLASVSRSMGLSVLRKQIYGVKRKTRKQIGGSWRDVDSLVIQVGIDGYRVIAERTGKYAGQLGPFWCAEDGKWQDVWLSDSPPAAAKVGVIRKDFSEPLWAVATYTSYAAIYDGKPQSLWARMPDVMLAKCAESLALRKAFPDEIGGTYTEEEMQQADNQPREMREVRELPPQRPAAPPPSTLPQTRNKVRVAAEVPEGATGVTVTMVDPDRTQKAHLVAEEPDERPALLKKLWALAVAYYGDRDKADTALHEWITVGYPEATKDGKPSLRALTAGQMREIIDAIEAAPEEAEVIEPEEAHLRAIAAEER